MKRQTFFAVLCMMVYAFTSTQAQTLTAMRDSVPGSYNFWFYEPAQTMAADSIPDSVTVVPQSKPLVVFLHGRSLSGTDLGMVRRYGTIAALEMGLELDAFVAAPQTNNGWAPEKVWQMVEWCSQHYAVDTNRIYVLGMSMGGYGTINTAAVYSDKIAAAMALCGGGTAKNYCDMCQMPLWIMHGIADEKVPVSASDKVVAAMAECGDTTRLIYSRLPGRNHSVLARLFYMAETYEWLLSHSLQDEGRPLCRTIDINNSHLENSYAHLSGKKAHITMRNGSTISDTYSAPRASSSSSSGSGHVHKVKQGDTLGAIARKHHTTVKKLCQLNGIKESSILRIGQKIKLP